MKKKRTRWQPGILSSFFYMFVKMNDYGPLEIPFAENPLTLRCRHISGLLWSLSCDSVPDFPCSRCRFVAGCAAFVAHKAL